MININHVFILKPPAVRRRSSPRRRSRAAVLANEGVSGLKEDTHRCARTSQTYWRRRGVRWSPEWSSRRPEAETKVRSSRRRRHGRLEASGRGSKVAPELQEHPTQSHVVGGGRTRPDWRRRRRSKLGEEKGIAGERERKRESERAPELDKALAILLVWSRRPEVARARLRGMREKRQRARLQRREVEGGADKRDPPVSGRSEAARSDSNASGLGGAESR